MKLKYLILISLFIFLSLPLIFKGQVTHAQAKPTIDYTLPYPGVLPDNGLYSLKVVRDKVVSFLIVDSSKKAAFNLLQADKRLQAGLYLLQKSSNNSKLAIETADKGENYFAEAISQTKVAINEKKDMTSFIDKLYLGSSKHIEVLAEYETYIKKEDKNELSRVQKRVKEFLKTVQGMQKKK